MKEITHDNLRSMKLHDILYSPGPERISILRVPGGWIYTSYADGHGFSSALSSCFVPYTNVDSARTDGADVGDDE